MHVAAGLTGIGTEPYFGIGQRAILVQTPEGAPTACLMHEPSAIAHVPVRTLLSLRTILCPVYREWHLFAAGGVAVALPALRLVAAAMHADQRVLRSQSHLYAADLPCQVSVC